MTKPVSEATSVRWQAISDVRDVNPLAWANGGPCITKDPELRAIAGYHASECDECNEWLAELLNVLEAKAALADGLRAHFDPDHGEMCDGLCEFLDAYDALVKPAAAVEGISNE